MVFCIRVMNMTLYERIRQLRIDAGMSQDDLAKAMGYSDRSMITKIESGKVDISQKKIISFARVLNTTTAYLMGLDEKEEPSADIPHTPEARILAKGIDKMPPAQREAIINMMKGLYPGLFEKGAE